VIICLHCFVCFLSRLSSVWGGALTSYFDLLIIIYPLILSPPPFLLSHRYISSIVVRYVIPLLHHICGDYASINKKLGSNDVPDAPLRNVVDFVEPSLAGVYFGSRMVANFKEQLATKCGVTAKEGEKARGRWVDLDKAMALAYPLFVYSDSMRAFSHVRAARLIQRWFKAGTWPPYCREEKGEKEERDGGEVAKQGREEGGQTQEEEVQGVGADAEVEERVESAAASAEDQKLTEPLSSPRAKPADAIATDKCSDSMRAFSHTRAARLIQRWFKAGTSPPPHNQEEEEEEEEGDGKEVRKETMGGGAESQTKVEQLPPPVSPHFSSPRAKLENAIATDRSIN